MTPTELLRERREQLNGCSDAEPPTDLRRLDLAHETLPLAGVSEIDAHAAAAVIRIRDPDSTEEQLARTRLWLAASEAHRERFAQLFARWCRPVPRPQDAAPVSLASARPSANTTAFRHTPLDAALACRDRVFRHILSRVGHPLAAHAILHETYWRFVLLSRADLQRSESLLATLLCLSRHVLTSCSRRDRPCPETGDRWGLPVAMPSAGEKAPFTPPERVEAALAAFPELSTQQRQILTFSNVYHYTVRGIATQLALPRLRVKAEMASGVRVIDAVLSTVGFQDGSGVLASVLCRLNRLFRHTRKNG